MTPGSSLLQSRSLLPIHLPEVVVAQQRVKDADGAARLRAAGQIGKGRLAPVPESLHRDSMLLVDAPGVGDIGAGDVVVAAPSDAADAADEVLAAGEVER
jgi:hypothetical protein